MKILHIIPSVSLVYGGPSQMVVGLAKAQAALGHQVTILTTDSNGDRGQAFVLKSSQLLRRGLR